MRVADYCVMAFGSNRNGMEWDGMEEPGVSLEDLEDIMWRIHMRFDWNQR